MHESSLTMGVGPDGKPFPVHAAAAFEYGTGALRGLVIGLTLRADGTLDQATPPLVDQLASLVDSLMTRGMYAAADVVERYRAWPSPASAEAPLRALPIALFYAGQPDELRVAVLRDGQLAQAEWRDRLAAVAISAAVSAGAFDLANPHDMGVAAVQALDEAARLATDARAPQAHAIVRDDLKRAVAAPSPHMLDEGAADVSSRALRHAFWHLIHGDELEASLRAVAARGEPLVAALTGVLLGAAYGSEAIPAAWQDAVAERAAPLLVLIAPE